MTRSTAPGQPGNPGRWTSSQKTGVGTAPFTRSRIWFTISHGIINEVYFPNVDKPNTRDMQFIVTDGVDFFSEEKRDCFSESKNLKPGVGAYQIINRCKQNQFEIRKTIFCNPYSATLIQETEFVPLVDKKFKVFVLLAPHIYGYCAHNSGSIEEYKGEHYLTAFHEYIHLALGCSVPFLSMSCGYVGISDGWTELKANKYLKNTYDTAPDGNIALTGEIDLEKSKGKFSLVLSFGTTFYEAAKEAKASFYHDPQHLIKKNIEGWEEIINKRPKISFIDEKSKALYDASVMVLNVHLGKIVPGNVIASLSIPWGESKGDNDLGGYHLIWPRDLVEIAGGFLAAGQEENARLILHFLSSIQEADGHFAQCLWHSGEPYWNNIQMDETALPVILAGGLKRRGALKWLDPWPLVQKAVTYLAKNGPVTLQDRWEEDGGYTPFTLACEISALLIGAKFFEERGLKQTAEYLREVADCWNSNIERWTYTSNSSLCKQAQVNGYYVRITPDKPVMNKTDEIIEVKNRPADHRFKPASEIVSTDALALVRFGLRAPDDPRILDTVKVIDYLLKIETKRGPSWRRYNEDGYGEHENGDSFDGTGIGRGWPLLAGERAHYEIALKNYARAKELLLALVEQSGEHYLIPEQIWDSKDIPDKLLFNGQPTLGAMPLVWAHAEYIKLVVSLENKAVYDCPTETTERYLKKGVVSNLFIWKPNHKINFLPKGKRLRIEIFEPCQISLFFDNKAEKAQKAELVDTGIGIYYFDLSEKELDGQKEVHFNFLNHPEFREQSFSIQLNV